MMTRGLYEHGQNAEVQKYNEEHVNETRAIEKHARKRYQRLNATDKLQALYFQGGHDFPPAIREKVYGFIDKHLKY